MQTDRPEVRREDIKLKPYNTKELSAIYGVCPKTMGKWIKRHEASVGKREGRLYSVAQVHIIFTNLGLPGVIVD
jgi:transposase-like protein